MIRKTKNSKIPKYMYKESNTMKIIEINPKLKLGINRYVDILPRFKIVVSWTSIVNQTMIKMK